MSSYVRLLKEKSRIQPPKWLPDNIMFEAITGSVAYGVSNDTSDMDIVGFCMPPVDTLFPHLAGDIYGHHAITAHWESEVHTHLLKKGVVHLTKEAALTHAEALFSLTQRTV